MAQSHPTLPADHPSIGRPIDIPYEHRVNFDLTTFPSPDAFASLCERHNLTKTDTVVDVTCDGFRSKYYHWYNDDVLLTTCCHPLTGERMPASGRLEYRDPGYASFLMLKGTTDAVVDLYADIVETADHIKGGDVTEDRIAPNGTPIQCEERFPDQLQQFYDNEMQASAQASDDY